MAAAANPAIASFLNQRPADMGASSLSTVVEALKDPAVAANLASNAANAALLKEVTDRLLAVANDGTKGTAVRVMGLECLYWISAGASEIARRGPLFLAVQQLNQSFDDMMEREGSVLSTQREMLTVLLLRCTGYTQLRAGDVLQQLCGGDDTQLVSLLLSLLRNPSYEWPLAQAALRWLYELTTPSTYFTAETATETTKVHAFQAKVGAMVEHCLASNALADVCALLSALWQRSATTGLSGGLAHCESISGVSVLSTTQQRELLQWAVVLRYVSVLVHNLSEFCDRSELVRRVQQSFTTPPGQTFLASVLIPFTMAAIHAWERDRTSSGRVGSSAAGDVSHDPFLNAAIAALRLLRFALYRSSPCASSTSSPSSNALSVPLLTALQHLLQHCTRLESTLKQEYPGMLVLLMAVQSGCNIDASTLRNGPVNLASVFEVLVATIAADKSSIRADSPYATSLAFAICFNRETSPFVESQNATVKLVHAKLAPEEAELKEDAETLEAILAMQEQLEYLQAVIMQAALGQLLAEIGSVSEKLDRLDSASGANPLLIGRRPSTTTPVESPSTHIKRVKKLKHPAEYCCQLTGRLMREPVVLKNGHRFEYDALMDVVQQMGHVDPVSGEDVNEELEVDEGLRQEIADYRVARAAKK